MAIERRTAAEIMQNATDLARTLGVGRPKVAILSAAQTVTRKIPSTIEAGNMLAKELTYLAGADAAGVVLGAQVPIILTSRADNLRARRLETTEPA
ncbi:MAG TPA: hypothetical protein VGI23_03010 [Steroidobacteraceae bacterium]